jgi:arylsulfatase A-like enzyme
LTAGATGLLPLLASCIEQTDSGNSGQTADTDGLGSHQVTREGLPNIFYVVIDTTRADHTSLHGYSRTTTPNLDALAQRSCVFHNAVSPSSWTRPTFSSILLGQHAFRHSFNLTEDSFYLEGSIISHLQEMGYMTVSIQSNHYLKYLDQEFDYRINYFPADTADESLIINFTDFDNMDDYLVEKAKEWVGNNAESGPFFMFLGLLSPHWLYNVHEQYYANYINDDVWNASSKKITLYGRSSSGYTDESFPESLRYCLEDCKLSDDYYRDAKLYIAGYDSEINYADAQLGKLVDYLEETGQLDNSIFVVISDHGECLDDYWYPFSHGESLYQRVVHVPMLFKLPHQEAAFASDSYVSTLDVMPTIFDYLGLGTTLTRDGKSLLSIMDGTSDGSNRYVYSYVEVSESKSYASAIKDGYKLVRQSQYTDDLSAVEYSYELYDLTQDPNEESDLSTTYPSKVSLLNQTLSEAMSRD